MGTWLCKLQVSQEYDSEDQSGYLLILIIVTSIQEIFFYYLHQNAFVLRGYHIGALWVFTCNLITILALCPWMIYHVTKHEYCQTYLTQWIIFFCMAMILLSLWNYFDHYQMKKTDKFYGAQCIRRIYLSEVAKFEENKIKFSKALQALNIEDFHQITADQ